MKKRGLSLIALIMTAFLCGCSLFSLGNSGIKKTMSGFLTAVQTEDPQQAKSFVVNPDDQVSLLTVAKNTGLPDDRLQTMKESFAKMTYEIGKVTLSEDEKTADVVVTMTVPDYSDAFAKALDASAAQTNESTALSDVMNRLAEANPSMVKKTVTCLLKKDGETWLIDLADNNLELQNAISGNLLNALQADLKM